MGRVRSRESTSNAAERSRLNCAQRSQLALKGVGGHGGHEGGERLVQPNAVPPAHGDQVAKPHVGDFVRNDICGPHEFGLRGLLPVDEQQHLPEGDAADVFHGAEGEVRNGHEVEFLIRVGNAVVRGEMAQR